MQDEVAVRLTHASKKFCRSLKHVMVYGGIDVARNALGLSSHPESLRKGEFWAVDNVSFEVPRGGTIGLIGPNGAGKSTVLKMINGIFMPDNGRIEIRGRVGALIEVGAGFHPMLTGRENVYINGAILGISRREIDQRFEKIIDFADIGDFIDAPVKHYSSGMFVRLGFAVAVHCEPDVLLVDEVLAVGDKDFALKCYQKIHEIRKQGVTIVLVSHNEYTIREQTEHCVYLDRGKVKFSGTSEEAINRYIRDTFEKRAAAKGKKEETERGGLRKAEITTLKFFDKDWKEISFLESGRELNIILECVIKEELSRPVFGANFYDDNGLMYSANSDYEQIEFERGLLGRLKVKVHIPHLYLPASDYLCSAVIAEESAANVLDWHNMAYKLVVGRAENARGSLKLPADWAVERTANNGKASEVERGN